MPDPGEPGELRTDRLLLRPLQWSDVDDVPHAGILRSERTAGRSG